MTNSRGTRVAHGFAVIIHPVSESAKWLSSIAATSAMASSYQQPRFRPPSNATFPSLLRLAAARPPVLPTNCLQQQQQQQQGPRGGRASSSSSGRRSTAAAAAASQSPPSSTSHASRGLHRLDELKQAIVRMAGSRAGEHRMAGSRMASLDSVAWGWGFLFN